MDKINDVIAYFVLRRDFKLVGSDVDFVAVSKTAVVQWVLQELDARWGKLIQEALAYVWPHTKRRDNLAKTQTFIAYVLTSIDASFV